MRTSVRRFEVSVMAELFVLEFEGFGEDLYKKVNEGLGIDMGSGQGDWPAGLLVHSAGKTEKGWMVVEVWDSRQAQDEFMKGRLGAALQQAGVDRPPSRAEWTSLAAHHQPAKSRSAAGAS